MGIPIIGYCKNNCTLLIKMEVVFNNKEIL